MKNLTKVTLIAATTLGMVGVANATVTTEPTSKESKLSEETGLTPKDLIVDNYGLTPTSVKPTTPPIRLACDSGNCSSNRC